MASTMPPCSKRAASVEPWGEGGQTQAAAHPCDLDMPQPLPSTLFAAGDEDEDESGEERLPSCFDYVMHFLTVFWKVLFACVPPTEYCNGWACFVVSILIIGMLTAVIGDLASHFGCTIGLKDSVTAVVFVAFGTSVPGRVVVRRECVGMKALQWLSCLQGSSSVLGWVSDWEGAPQSPAPRQGLYPTW